MRPQRILLQYNPVPGYSTALQFAAVPDKHDFSLILAVVVLVCEVSACRHLCLLPVLLIPFSTFSAIDLAAVVVFAFYVVAVAALAVLVVALAIILVAALHVVPVVVALAVVAAALAVEL